MASERGRVEAHAITIKDPVSGRMLLDEISLAISSGEVVAVAGREGAGKSLLAKALVGAYAPTSGRVTLDGHSLRSIDPEALGEAIGYLPADEQLGTGQVGEVIARSTSVHIQKIIDAARLANVHSAILDQPTGYLTAVESEGAFSYGQRRRIALARCCFGHPRLVVLDEPTAGLDSSGDRDVANAVQRLRARGCAVVVVTRSETVLKSIQTPILS